MEGAGDRPPLVPPTGTSPPPDLKAWAMKVSAEHARVIPTEERAGTGSRPDAPIGPPTNSTADLTHGPVIVVRTKQSLPSLARRLPSNGPIALTLLMNELDPMNREVVGVGLAGPDVTAYVPVAHRDEVTGRCHPDQLPLAEVIHALDLHRRPLVGHDTKIASSLLRDRDGGVPHFVWDTMLAAKLLAPHLPADLDQVARRELGEGSSPHDELPRSRVPFAPIDRAANWCSEAGTRIWRLYQLQQADDRLSRFLIEQVELPLVRVVVDLEADGYQLDPGFFSHLEGQLRPEQEALLARIREVAGPAFNPNSSGQICRLLFDELRLPVTGRTSKDNPSVAEAALMKAAEYHPVAAALLRHRTVARVLNTYCRLPEKADRDGRLRVPYQQLDAVTGRFTSASVIQTLPKSDQFHIRNGFVARPGHMLVGADYDQQELRVLAQVSGDPTLISAVREGVDLHGLAACRLFGLTCAPGDVKRLHPQERDRAKAVQFGLIYGITPAGLAHALSIPAAAAKQLFDDYFRQFPRVREFLLDAHIRLERHGFVSDVFGRRRYFPELSRGDRPRTPNDWMTGADQAAVRAVEKARREAQNFLVQGPSATVTKLAMLNCHRHIRAEHPDVRLVLTLHDELHFEVPEPLVPHFADELPALMYDLGLDRFGFVVPMKVTVRVGPSWGQMRDRVGRGG